MPIEYRRVPLLASEQLSALLDHHKHRGVGGQGAEDTGGEAACEPPPPPLQAVQLPGTVGDAVVPPLAAPRRVRLHRRLDHVEGVGEQPVEQPAGRPTHAHCPRRRHRLAGRRQRSLRQLHETWRTNEAAESRLPSPMCAGWCYIIRAAIVAMQATLQATLLAEYEGCRS